MQETKGILMTNLTLSITFGLIETMTNNDSWLVTLVFKLLGLGRVMFEYYHVFFFFQFCFDSKILYTPQNKTTQQSIRIVTFLRWHMPYASLWEFLNFFGLSLSWLLPFLLIECLLKLLTMKPHQGNYIFSLYNFRTSFVS